MFSASVDLFLTQNSFKSFNGSSLIIIYETTNYFLIFLFDISIPNSGNFPLIMVFNLSSTENILHMKIF